MDICSAHNPFGVKEGTTLSPNEIIKKKIYFICVNKYKFINHDLINFFLSNSSWFENIY